MRDERKEIYTGVHICGFYVGTWWLRATVLCGEYSFTVNKSVLLSIYLRSSLPLSNGKPRHALSTRVVTFEGGRSGSPKKRTCITVPFIFFFRRKIYATTRAKRFTQLRGLMVFSPLLADLRGFRGNERWAYRNWRFLVDFVRFRIRYSKSGGNNLYRTLLQNCGFKNILLLIRRMFSTIRRKNARDRTCILSVACVIGCCYYYYYYYHYYCYYYCKLCIILLILLLFSSSSPRDHRDYYFYWYYYVMLHCHPSSSFEITISYCKGIMRITLILMNNR